MKNEKLLDRIETEALVVLEKFKEHPVKTIILSLVVLWFLKKVISWVRREE